LLDEILPVVGFFWVDQALHQDAVIALLAAGRRDLSLVDWVSFEGMRQKGIQKAFAFDEDFQAQGFVVVPSTG
ncbi:MAG: VapC toxin family PIN domain ribonuclease, partial [Armatimonadota bacterium]|nr:VapC toxin family PIN domain ribonuclease [Armatimonadota bacterium]